MEWLSDNGPPYTAHETCEFGRSLGLLIRTTPAYSPESNGMAEAFVKGVKRDYVYVSRLETAEKVLTQLPAWMLDYNIVHPHKGLGCARQGSTGCRLMARKQRPMPEMDDAIYERVCAAGEAGNALFDAGDYDGALQHFQEGWDLIPEPRYDYEAAHWFLAGMADALFNLRRFEEARDTLTRALALCPETRGNAFFHLLLGMSHLELGDEDRATNSLVGAYMLDGKEAFSGDDLDPKYFEFLRSSKALAPPGGWDA